MATQEVEPVAAAPTRRWPGRHELLDRVGPVAGPVAIVVIVAVLVASFGGEALGRALALGLVNVVLVVGLYIFVGNSGILSFGQMSFMAIGAYISGALTIPLLLRKVLLPNLPGPLAAHELSTIPAVLLAACVAAVIGFAVAVPLMRLSGLAAGIATLAVLQITYVVASNWNELTGGAASMPGVPRTVDWPAALTWAVVAIVLAYAFQQSRAGLALRASREDEAAAAAVGIHVVRLRRLAFGLSAFVIGIGGGLYVHYLGTFSPSSFYLGTTFLTLAMLVVGGMNSLLGAVVGAVLVSAISEALVRVEQSTSVLSLREVALALIMLGILILRPGGITDGAEFDWRWLRRRRRAPRVDSE
jgi:branched-chain amino acid transport system permease protein